MLWLYFELGRVVEVLPSSGDSRFELRLSEGLGVVTICCDLTFVGEYMGVSKNRGETTKMDGL